MVDLETWVEETYVICLFTRRANVNFETREKNISRNEIDVTQCNRSTNIFEVQTFAGEYLSGWFEMKLERQTDKNRGTKSVRGITNRQGGGLDDKQTKTACNGALLFEKARQGRWFVIG